MPSETNPITDPARLAAEDAEQARELYRAALQQQKHQQQQQKRGGLAGSTDVLTRNTCSSVSFRTGVSATAAAAAQRVEDLYQQQQQQQQQQEEEAEGQQAAEDAAAGVAAADSAAAAAGTGAKQPGNKLASLWSKAPPKKVRGQNPVPAELLLLSPTDTESHLSQRGCVYVQFEL
jgi:hypothetical protein